MNLEILEHLFLGNTLRNYLLFVIILCLGLLLKRIFSKLLSKLLYKLFNKLGNFHGEVFAELLITPIEILLFFIVIYLAINQLDYPLQQVIFSRQDTTAKGVVSIYQVTIIQVLDKIFLFFFISTIFWIGLRIIDFVAHVFFQRASLTESKSDAQMVPFAKELGKIVTIIIGVFVIMGAVFNLNVATIVAGLGIGGIAVALAAQDTLQNLLGSFTIFADKPFVVGDLVRVDKYEGTIEKVGFRSTLLRTLDKTMVIIPNKKMIDSPVENLTLRNLRRIKFNIGLKYDTPSTTISKISSEITEYVNKHSSTSNDTLVTFDSFGDSSVNLQVQYFIEQTEYTDYMKVKEEINYQIMEIVMRNGAGFAYPSQTVYHQYPASSLPPHEQG
ncbi:MAG: mechanosensitive ion channel protein MscS [Sphingobacteriales bacterium]|nr:mechanosensitive ion channel protein MscS [Sphingobacteriales bacterium]